MLFWTLLSIAACVAAAPRNDQPTVTLTNGVFVGTQTQIPTATPVVNKFLGIPFAAPVQRFVKPQVAPPSRAVQNVVSEPPVCLQQFSFPEASRSIEIDVFNNPAPEEAEDCLFLNVFAPADAVGGRGTGKAVMFWIFGGGFQFGGASLPQYDGSFFAANQDVVLVAANYRTNVFGFPGDVPEVPAESRNLGFYDQRFALQWVQDNIAKFGGDPDKVTIFGESAGAVAVDLLILTHPVDPPFRAGILESGSDAPPSTSAATGPPPTPPLKVLAESLNCAAGESDFECVRTADALTIQNIIEEQALGFPVIADDPVTTVKNSTAKRASRDIANVPILIGNNANEFRIFLFFDAFGNESNINFDQFVGAMFPNDPDEVATLRAAFPPGSPEFPTDFDAVAALVTASSFNCPTSRVAQLSAKAGFATYRYLYNATFPNTTPFPGAGAFHSSEIPQVFGLYPNKTDVVLPPPTPEELELSRAIQTAWASFAKDPQDGPRGIVRYAASPPQFLGDLGGINPVGITPLNVAQQDSVCSLFE